MPPALRRGLETQKATPGVIPHAVNDDAHIPFLHFGNQFQKERIRACPTPRLRAVRLGGSIFGGNLR